MISVNKEGQIVYVDGKTVLAFRIKEDYIKFIIMITNPNNQFKIENLDIDTNIIDDRLISICKKYNEFLVEFLNMKNEIIIAAKDEVDNIK